MSEDQRPRKRVSGFGDELLGNNWDIGISADGWPRALGPVVIRSRLQKCGVCGEWHWYGSTPEKCLDYLADRASRRLEVIPTPKAAKRSKRREADCDDAG